MMRLGFSVSLLVGSVVSFSGCAAMFMSLPDSAAAMSLGIGLISATAGAKAYQSKYEANNDKSSND